MEFVLNGRLLKYIDEETINIKEKDNIIFNG